LRTNIQKFRVIMLAKLEDKRERKGKESKEKLLKKSKKGATNRPIEVNDQTFDSTIKEHKTMVIDCWAEWCGPCRMIAPTIEAMANDYAGKVVFGKLYVDENSETATKYCITSIPTLLFFKDGKLVGQIIGAVPRQQIEQRLKTIL
jgi:thioredoxin 1